MSDVLPPVRIGHGYDIHRLKAGGTLKLGGVTVAGDRSFVAHSDGDVVCHAVVDALLGAVAEGDIGRHFPDTDPQWRDAASERFVTHAAGVVRRRGYGVGNVDVTVSAEAPRLAGHIDAMRASLASMLGTDAGRVSVKAGTNEGCDAVGRGEAVAATCVILLLATPS